MNQQLRCGENRLNEKLLEDSTDCHSGRGSACYEGFRQRRRSTRLVDVPNRHHKQHHRHNNDSQEDPSAWTDFLIGSSQCRPRREIFRNNLSKKDH